MPEVAVVRALPGCPARSAFVELRVPKAAHEVVVHHTDRLHVGIDDGRADEGKSALSKVLAERVRDGRPRRDVLLCSMAANDRLAVDESPLVLREASELFLHGEKCARILDRRLDLHAISDDARIAEKHANATRVVARDEVRIEAIERAPVRISLAKDRDPRKPGLSALEHQELEEPPVVSHGNAPLAVVIADVERVLTTPSAAGQGSFRHAGQYCSDVPWELSRFEAAGHESFRHRGQYCLDVPWELSRSKMSLPRLCLGSWNNPEVIGTSRSRSARDSRVKQDPASPGAAWHTGRV